MSKAKGFVICGVPSMRALIERRKAAGLSQHAVARRMGKSQTSVVKIERHDPERMQLWNLREYVKALGGELVVRVEFSEREDASDE